MLRQPRTPQFSLNVTTDWWTSLGWFYLLCEPQILKQEGGAIVAFLQSRDVTELVSEVCSSEKGNKSGSNPGFGFQLLAKKYPANNKLWHSCLRLVGWSFGLALYLQSLHRLGIWRLKFLFGNS